MRRFVVTNPNLSVGETGTVVDASQLHMTDEKLDEWVEAGYGYEIHDPDPGPFDLQPFDPAEHTVPVVLAHIEQHPDDADDIIESERTGRNRSGIVNTEE